MSQHSPQSALDDFGVGVFGQGTVTSTTPSISTAGARLDYESKEAMLDNFSVPAIAVPATVDAEESFSNVSPQFSMAYRLQPDKTVYATVARGFKAGGFNAASPAESKRTARRRRGTSRAASRPPG